MAQDKGIECVLCQAWNQSGYAARSTTPVSNPEAHGLLVAGFWLGATNVDKVLRDLRADGPSLCERHAEMLADVEGEPVEIPAQG